MAKADPPLQSKRRLRILVGILVLVGGVAAAWWTYRAWPPSLPAAPTIDVADADPELAEAITAAQAALKKAPRSLEAWSKLGMTLHAHKYTEAAITCYEAAAALDSANPLWPYYIGVLHHTSDHPERALPSLQRAAQLAPREMPVPRLRLAELLLDLDRTEDAEKEFRRVLGDQPDDVRARFGLAQVAVARQKPADAIEHLIPIMSDPFVAKRGAALAAAAYTQLGKHEDATRERRRLQQLPDDPPWPDLLGPVYELRVGLAGRLERAESLRRDPQAALAFLEDTVRRYPESDQAWIYLGVARENVKDAAGAEKAYARSIELAPRRADHRFTMGEFLQAQQRFKDAAEAYRKAIELRPHDADTHFKLGECLQESGDRHGAVDAFRRALQCRPDLKEARIRLQKLEE